MYDALTTAKMAAEKHYADQYGGAQTVAAPQAYYGDTCNAGAACKPRTTAESLGAEAFYVEERLKNMHRAADILAKHPEFEDLIWLIRSGLI